MYPTFIVVVNKFNLNSISDIQIKIKYVIFNPKINVFICRNYSFSISYQLICIIGITNVYFYMILIQLKPRTIAVLSKQFLIIFACSQRSGKLIVLHSSTISLIGTVFFSSPPNRFITSAFKPST